MKKEITWLLFALLFLSPLFSTGQSLYINEIVASNTTGITEGVDNSRFDWFEIYNATNAPIDIAGYSLTDNASLPTKFTVPSGSPGSTTIPAYGYLVVWASNATSRGPLHTNFAFSKGGEYVGIYSPSPSSTLIDGKTFGAQTDNISFGRNPDGGANFSYYSTSSPAASNSTGVVQLTQLAVPTLSHVAGFHTAAFSLTMTHPEPDVSLWYSTDGSEPVNNNTPVVWQYKNVYDQNGTPDQAAVAMGVGQGLSNAQYKSQVYATPLSIIDRTVQSNSVSMKNTTFYFHLDHLPSYKVFKGTTIRVRAYKEGFLPSEIVTRTFFVDPAVNKYPVPVIAVTSSENNFFEYQTGIYTAGRKFDIFRWASPNEFAWICTEGNYSNSGDLWERPGHIEFFENGNSINQPFAFRIHGGCTRSLPLKTLRLYSNTEFDFPIFPEKPTLFSKRLQLRNSGNDYNSTLLRDVFYQSLLRNLPFDTQLSRPAVVFVNSEYWGIHSVTERYDKYYLEKKYAVNRDDVDIIEIEGTEVEEGDLVKFNELNTFLSSNDLSVTANYNTLKTMVDIPGFTDYMITEIFSGNTDWPNKNIRIWRAKTPDTSPTAAYGHDGKWRMMFYDIDLSLGNQSVSSNLFPRARGKVQYSNSTIATIFDKLLANTNYLQYFMVRAADLMNSTFIPSRTRPILASTKAMYLPLMADHVARWKSPTDIGAWNSNIAVIDNFMNLRPGTFRNNVRDTFGSGYANSTVTVNVSDAAAGHVKVNTIDILPTTDGISATPYPWSGTYFKDNTTTLKAIPAEGYRFVRWEDGSGTALSTEEELSFVTPSETTTRKAIFATTSLPVVLEQFSAKKKGTQVEIQWQTASEIDNDYFEIQRAADSKSWASISIVQGASTTSSIQRYHAIDETPLSGVNYYRLKQFDVDGTFSLSRIAAIDMGEAQLVDAGPNPVSDFLNLSLDKSLKNLNYEIVDITGRAVAKADLNGEAGKAAINVKKLPEGLFVLTLKAQGEIKYRMKFVKR